MTHYSYLKEPVVESSGYTLGYKLGSFSYLENGTIDFSDDITYYDGQYDGDHSEVDSDRNRTVENHQRLYFDGTKGISEIYAKGFYPSNRALSAWKKVRYDDMRYNFTRGSTEERERIVYLGRISKDHRIEPSRSVEYVNGSYNLYRDGRSYLSNKIAVKADVTMGPAPNAKGEYNFDYVANVTNGVVEIKDATGWTNETPSKRIDWERDALMTGNVNVTNKLEARGLLFPAAPPCNDWLPCCFSGTNPPIENIGPDCGECGELVSCGLGNSSGSCNNCIWPTECITETVLSPEKKLLPDTNCSGNLSTCHSKCQELYKSDSLKRGYCMEDCNKTCGNFTCTDGVDCPGFECFYTYCPGEGTWTDGEWTPEAGPGGKRIVQEYRVTIEKYIDSLNGQKFESMRYGSAVRAKNNISNGDTITYEIRVNYGDTKSTLRNVTITDTLPEGLIFVPGSATYKLSQGNADAESITLDNSVKSIIVWNVPTIGPGQVLHIEYDTHVVNATATRCLIFNNKAEVQAFVETDTQWVERKAKIEGASAVASGQTLNCDSV